MRHDVNRFPRNTFLALLHPIVSTMLRCSIGWQDFKGLAKDAYIQVANESLFGGFAATRAERISELTKLPIEQVDLRLYSKPNDLHRIARAGLDAAAILAGWHQDPSFANGFGGPMPLDLEGRAPSFEALCKKIRSSTRMETLIDELLDAGSITINRDGRLIALRRYHIPASTGAGHVLCCCNNLQDHARTAGHNTLAAPKNRLFEGIAISDRVSPKAIEEFHNFVNRRAQQLLVEVDDWLESHRLSANNLCKSPTRLGLGVYAIEGTQPEGTLS